MGMKYNVLGLMSGTSLDGLDIAFCEFKEKGGQWSSRLLCANTIAYPQDLHEKLYRSTAATAMEITILDRELGKWYGERINEFIHERELIVDAIASHGHTVFHQPENGFTLQIGNGNDISAITGLPVIYDFRSLDVALGGQGAPLVPVGDRLLFSDYDFCLNLGGIANISYEKGGRRLAYDICPCNMVLNHIAKLLDLPYDKGGQVASGGVAIKPLLQQLNQLKFYQELPPKSLGYEWVEKNVFPLIKSYYSSPADLMRTFSDHIVHQISRSVVGSAVKGHQLLVTGGGGFNTFLIEELQKNLPEVKVVLPESEIINYKEAIIFAFLGVLRLRSENNCLAEVTGASRSSSGGVLTGGL